MSARCLCIAFLAGLAIAAPVAASQDTRSEEIDDYSIASSALLDYLYATFSSDPDGNLFFASNNIAVPRERFLECGGFDSGNKFAAGEDREFCFRWRRRGFPMVRIAAMRVAHRHPLSLASFCELHFRYGQGAVQYHKSRARNGASRVHFESPRFYLAMPRYAFAKFRGAQAWRIAALLAISQASHLAGYLCECIGAVLRAPRGFIPRASSPSDRAPIDPLPSSDSSPSAPARPPVPEGPCDRTSPAASAESS